MVSLLAFANVTEDGVNFRSPFDGKAMLLTPEKSIELQNTIGSDIMMQLDDVVRMIVVVVVVFCRTCSFNSCGCG